MKALVIGSEGNIGKPLVRYLREKGYSVYECDHKPAWRPNYVMADLRNASDLLQAFDCKPDVVFHLAAMVSRVTCEQAASLAVDVNLTGTQNVLDLTKRANAHLVYFSTSEVYGPEIEFMDEATTPKPNNRYGLTKLLSESLVEYEVKQHGLSAVILRPFMMYDEDEDLGDHRSAMIRFATNLALGRSIEVHAASSRAWFHVSDAVRSIEAAARVRQFSIINIGSDDIRSIAELASLIAAELNAPKTLISEVQLPSRMTLHKRPNLQRQKEILGVTPIISFEQGVKRVCKRVTERLIEQGLLIS
jgi:nucleoside-diphosphate-sugar epimerase